MYIVGQRRDRLFRLRRVNVRDIDYSRQRQSTVCKLVDVDIFIDNV